MGDGQREKKDKIRIKGLGTKRTKFGQRYLLTEKDESGKEHSITVPICDGDDEKTVIAKVEESRKRLRSRFVKTFDEMLDAYCSTRMLSNASKALHKYSLRGFSYDERQNRIAVHNLLTSDRKKTTIVYYLKVIHRFFDWLSKRVAIENPADGVSTKCDPSPRTRIMTDNEIAQLLIYAKKSSPKYRLFILILLYTGARVSSVKVIRKSDLTESGLQLYNVKRRRYYEYKIPIKNQEIIDLWNAAGDGEIFGKDGDRFHMRLNTWMSRKFGKDQRGESLSIHSFRHTFASRAAMDGVSIEVVSKLLDHQSVATTIKFYARFSNEQISDAVEKAVKGFSEDRFEQKKPGCKSGHGEEMQTSGNSALVETRELTKK